MKYKLFKDDFYLYTIDSDLATSGKEVDIPEARIKWLERIFEENRRAQDYLRELDHNAKS